MSLKIARVIYRWCRGKVIFAALAISFALSFGGISTFIIAFTVYPITFELFRRAGYNRALLPAAILFCPTTLCMTMLPGVPSIQNMIPTNYLDTNIYASPVLGVLAAVVTGVLGLIYLHKMAERLPLSQDFGTENTGKEPNCFGQIGTKEYASLLPCIVLWMLTFLLVLTGFDSLMAVAVALLAGTVTCILLSGRKFAFKSSINSGIKQGLQTLAVTSCIMGYGTLVQSTAGFEYCTAFFSAPGGLSILSGVAAINLVAAITGSSSASLQLFYQMFGAQVSHWGISNAGIHRITAIASGGLDSMPYATGVAAANELSGLEMRHTYPHVFVTCAVIPLFTLFLLLLILSFLSGA